MMLPPRRKKAAATVETGSDALLHCHPRFPENVSRLNPPPNGADVKTMAAAAARLLRFKAAAVAGQSATGFSRLGGH